MEKGKPRRDAAAFHRRIGGFYEMENQLAGNRTKLWPAVLMVLAAMGLAFWTCNIGWHTSQSYLVILGRYSTEYFALIVTLVLAAGALSVHGLLKPGTKAGCFFKGVFEVIMIGGYTLAGCFSLTECWLHHHPSWVQAGASVDANNRAVLNQLRWIVPDPEIGKLPPLNVHKPDTKPSCYPLDAIYDYPPWTRAERRVIPYYTDSNGFRNDYEVETADLVVVGDSFTEAGGVRREEIWSSVVADQIGYSEINLGHGGYCPQQEEIAFRRYGLPRNPKLVLMQLFLGNDMDDSLGFELWKKSGKSYPDYVRDGAKVPPVSPTLELFERFLVNFTKQDAISPDSVMGSFKPIEVSLAGEQLPIAFAHELHLLMKTEEELEGHCGMRPMLEAIERTADACDISSIPFAVCLIPGKLRFYYDYISDSENLSRLIEQQKTVPIKETPEEIERLIRSRWDNQSRVISRFLENRQIHCIDLTQTFVERVAETGDVLYFPGDTHWNPEGHRLAGLAVADWLREKRLAPDAQLHASLDDRRGDSLE